MKNNYTLRTAGMSLLFAIVALFGFNQQTFAEANYVYHEATTNNPGCGPNYRSVITPNSSQTLTVAWKVEFQFYTDNVRLYYTTDGSTPSGAFGVGTGTTQVLVGSYNCTFGGPVVDVATATIPAFAAGKTVKYIVSAWHSAGGDEIFANGPGAGCACGTPTNNSSLATVFSYTVANANNVEVSATTGTTIGSYSTLKGAFDAINAGTHTGTIAISMYGNTTETASAVLNASGSGSASYSAISIKPAGGGARSVTGAIAGNLIDLNGADNVTIDGLNTGGNSLTIENTDISTSATTLRFIADATSNTLQNCTVKGAGSSTTLGTIFFSTGTTTGNDGNNITNNSITASGANFATNSIYSAGTSAAIDNSGISISGNNISDYFNAGSVSVGINVGSTGNSAWTITNNKLFQTALRLYTTSNIHNGIFIGVGSGYTITGNTIGFANSSGTGMTMMVGNSVSLSGTFPSAWNNTGTANATRYIAINCAFTAAGTVSNIQNNTIAGFALYTSSGATTTNGIFCGINVTSGNVNIGTTTGNVIGATTGQGSIYAACNTAGGAAVGIFVTSANTVSIQNNTIGAIDAAGAVVASGCGGITGIDVAGAGTFTISNNTIGNTTANNLRAGNLATGSTLSNTGAFVTTTGVGAVIGIRSAATGATLNITGNTLRGFAMSTTSSSSSSAFTGITNTGSATSAVNITGNFLGTASLGLLNYAFAIGSSSALTGISCTSAGSAATVTISNNDFQGITYAVTGANANTYINCSAAPLSFTANLNTFTNLNVNTTGGATFISHSYTMSATGTQTISNNSIVTAFNKGGAGGTVTVTTTNGSSVNGSTCNTTGNNFSNITVTGATAITGINNTDGLSGGTSAKTITGNTFNSWSGGSSSILGINVSYFHTGTSTVSSNTITNLSGSSSITGISINSSANSATSLTIGSNTINNLNSTGSSVTGITCANTSPTINISSNTIGTLSTTAGSAVTGIAVTGATTTNVFKNKIYDLSGSNASTTVNGILISGGTTVSAYNNLIGDLRTNFANASNPLNGINITGGTTVNAYYNTVRLSGTSAGATFGSSAISASTSSTLTLRNNIFINNSTSNGAGLSVAYRRSSTTLTSYGSTSDRNIYFAPIIYYDGTSGYTLSTFKALVTPRDANSQTENVAFISVTGSSSNFLHPVGTQTYAESGGSNVSGITDDFDGDVRQGNGGYAGTGTAPDIGGDEFNGTPPPVCSGTPTAGVISGASSVCSGTGTTLTLTGASTDIGITYQWKFSTTQGGPYTNNLGTGTSQATGNLTVATYYVVTVTCTQGGGGTATTSEFAVGINTAPTVSVSSNPSNATICGSGSVSLTASASTSSTSRMVLVQNFSYTPATMNVNVGDVIHFVWVNGVHSTTSSSVPGGAATWDAPISSATPTFDYTVTTAGTYNYFCTVHGAGVMSGTFTAGNPTYTWSPATGLNTTTGATVTASPTSTTTYTVTATNGVGCTGTGTKTVSVGPSISVTSVTATPSSVCSGGNSALNAVVTSSAVGYTVSSISYGALTPSGSATVLASAGVNNFPGIFLSASGGTMDDGVWDGISMPFTLNFWGTNYSAIRIGTNGNVQFGGTATATRNPGSCSYTSQTIPTAGGYLDNFIGSPWMDLDLSGATGNTLQYFTNGSAPNRVFVISWENCTAFNSSDLETAQILIYENGIFEVHLGGNGLAATSTKAIGTENSTGSLGAFATGRNSGTWTTSANEAWRFTPAGVNYLWSPSTFLNNTSISNPTASNVTATTTYTVTASDATVSACTATGSVTLTSNANVTYYQDNDNDTYGNPSVTQSSCTGAPAGYVVDNTDCNDNNSAVHPGVTEVCNTIDDNCNGQIDEGVQSTFYADADNDSYGNAAVTTLACTAPAGYVANSTDCNDGNSAVNPGATEICNSIDDDCDTQIDEGVQSTFYADADNDFYGNAAVSTLACTAPAGYVSNNTDCDDGNAAVNPGATEVCNTIDDDCDGFIDEGVQTTFYADADADTYGNAAVTTMACAAPFGYVSNSGDCDDTNPAINPNATEVCNTVDDDCDGFIDEGVQSTFYADADNDFYGNAAVTTLACSAPAGYISDNTDCNDNDAAVHALQSFYVDGDNDTYGSTNTSLVCAVTPPSGYSNNNTDCNDANANVNPGATEQCNGVDDNCDGTVDEGCTTFTYFADTDNDNYGDPNNSITSIENTPPAGYVSNNTDCNDNNNAINPGATEMCNTVDDDCDGFIDEGVQSTFYADADNDFYGNAAATTLACSAPAGYVSNSTDCNDANMNVNPGATEACNTIDDDCDGFIDEGVQSTFYADADNDSYGNASVTTLACSAPVGYVSDNTDCNDGNSSIHPNQSDLCNSVDDDCDGFTDEDATFSTWYADADGDTYGNAAISQSACSQPSGYVSNSTDCNDGNSAIHPGATDVCNNTDDDCDGSIDEDATFSTWYADSDNDNYGNAASTTSACSQPSGYVSNNTDCNDANAAIHPGAQELCNGIDDDCDGTTDNVASPVASFTSSCNLLYPGNTSSLTSTSTAGSGTIVSYQWILNGNSISGATNSTYTTGANANGNYSLRVTNSNSCSNTSSPTSISNLSGALAGGSYTIPSTCGFSSINSAVTYTNTNGISGSVVFNVTAPYTENAPSGGIVLNQCALSSSLQSNSSRTITFQKSGSGSVTINAATGTGTTDGIVKIVGTDYITFNGINLNDGNTTNATTEMEWGYAILKCDGNNGANNNTIKNCSITLNKANTASVGIYSGNHNATSTTGLTYSGGAGNEDASRNGRNVFFGNTISNVYTGISLNGNASASGNVSLNDTLNQIGVIAQTANSITNFGGGATAVNAIIETNERGLNIDNNSINGGTGTGNVAMVGISMVSGVWGNVRNNTITLASSATTAAMTGITVGFSGGSAANPDLITISGNIIQNVNYTTSTSAAFTGITCTAGGTSAVITVTGNTVQNNTVAGTGTFSGIICSSAPSGGTVNFTNNTVSGNTCSNVSTTVHTMTLIAQTGSPTNMFLTGNTVNNNSHSGVGTITGCVCTGAPTNLTYSTNTITNNTMTGGAATCTITCMQASTSTYTVNGNIVNNNGITSMSGTSTATVVGFTNSASAPSETITNNTLRRLYVTGSSTGTHIIRGMLNNILSTTARTVTGNRIDSLYSTGSATITGITSNAGGTVLYSKNRIFNLIGNGANSIVTGLLVTTGTQVGIYNNYIGDLKAPTTTGANAVIGISHTGGTAVGLYYNTIMLSGTGGATFGSSCVSSTSTATLEMRNNLLDNLTTPGSTSGNAVAYRRSSTGFTGYTTASNNNMFYAGTPATNHLIYFDGTNSSQTLSAYQTLAATRDQASVTENVSFASTTPGASNYLHINTAVATQTESGAVNVTGITDDFDSDIRQGNTGYSGSGTAPDIGADEFAGISPVPQITNVTVPTGGNCASVSHVINADVTTAAGNLTTIILNYNNGATGSTAMTLVSGNTYTGTIPGASPTNTNVTWSITATNDVPFSKTFTGATYNDATPLPANTINVTATTPSFCGTGGTTTLTATSNDANYAYTWAASGTGTLSTTTGPTTDATVTQTTSFVVTGVDGACQLSVSYSVGVYIFPTVVPSASPATICTGSTSTLSSGVSSLSFSVASAPYAFINSPQNPVLLCSNGTQSTTISTGTLDDGGWYNVPIGFSFNYFGTTYTTVNVSTNGNIQFGSTANFSTSFTPGAIPNTAVPNNFIAVCWSDFLFTTQGTIRYFMSGTAPNRKFVVEYNGPFYNAGSPTGNMTGQVWLFETTGQVEVHLLQSNGLASTGGGVKSLGVENLDGTIGAAAPGRNGTAWQTTVPEAWHFEPPHNYTFNWQPAGQISGSNTTSSVTATPGTMPYTVYTVNIVDPVTTCSGTFTDTVFVQPIPSAPTVTPTTVNITAGDQVSFTASGASGATFHVYDAPTGGNLLFTGSTYNGPGPCTTSHFYVDQVTGVCASSSRTDVTINVTPITAPTVTGNLNVCGNTTTTLTASNPASGHNIKWYDAASGGNLVFTGTVFTTPILTATTTYYASEENTACSSTRTPVTVNWTAATSITVTNSNPVFCGSSSIVPVNLGVSSADNNYAYAWAESQSGTLNTLSGNSVTANVTTTTNYTVTAVNSGTGCSTAANTSITVFSFPTFTASASPSNICLGSSSNISAGVSAGAFSVSSIAYAPHTVPNSGVTTLVHSGIHDVTPSITSISFDDEGWFNQPIGFTFNFFGVNNTVFHVSSNGNIQFGNTANFSTSYTPGAVPSTTLPNNFVGLFWQDLYLASTGTIRYWVDGNAPNRVLVVEFLNIPGYTTVGNQSGQILLYESTGVIETHLGSVTDATHVKVDGVEDVTGTIGSAAPGRNGTVWSLTSPEAWRYQPPVNYTFAWSPAAGLNSTTSGNPVATPTTTTTYHVLVTDPITGCTKTDSVTVTVIGAPPAVSVTPSSAIICSPGGTAVTLTASGDPATYTWAPSTGLNTSTGNTVNSLPSSSTTYTVTATSSAGCTALSSPVSVAIVNAPVISSVTATPPGVCVGGSSTLVTTVSGPSTYCANSNTTNTIYGIDSFYTTGGASNITNNASGFSASGYGNFTGMTVSQAVGAAVNFHLRGLATYTYGWGIWVDWNQDGTFSAGEQMYSSGAYLNSTSGSFTVPAGSLNGNTRMRVVADDLNTVPPACDNSAYNETEDYTFNITGGVTVNYSYTWSPATFLNSTTGSTVTANGVTTTTSYTVTVSDGTCSSTGGVTVNSGAVAVNPTSVQTSSGAACTGSTFQLSSGLTGGGFPYTYTWAPSTGLNNATISNPVATVASTTTYTLSVTDNCGSSASGTVTITVSPVPAVVVTPNNPNICSGTTIALTASGDVATYTWSPAAGLNSTTGSTVNASPTSTRTYNVVATSGSGCTSTASTTVTVSTAPSVTTTATPNLVCPGGNSQLLATATSPGNSAAGYNFTPSSGTFTPIAGTGGSVEVTAVEVDDVIAGAVPLGFTFNYEGTSYTNVYPSSNGFLSFNPSSVGGTVSQANALATATANWRPLVAALWDDLDGNTTQTPNSKASYVTTGPSGSRVFTFEWYKWQWYFTSNVENISFQIKLYEGSNRIDFIYQQEANPASGGSASVGIAGANAGVFLSLDGTGTSPAASSSAETATLNVSPATGQVYTFMPPTATGVTYAWSPATFLNDATINNPMASGVPSTTTYTVTATIGNGCSASSAVTVNVADTTFFGLNPDYCEGDGAVFITPVTPGGTFSGTGVSPYQGGAVFDPAVSGVGTFVVTYTLPYGCGSSQSVTVHPIPTVTLESFAPTCSNTPPFILTGGSPAGGTYFDQFGYVTNGNTFDPGAAGAGSHTIFYAYSDPYGCSAFAQGDITVNNPTITVYADNDNDGYGTGDPMLVCIQPAGTSLNNTDCNDNDATVHTPQLYYVDADHDGYGSTTSAMLCSSTAPTGYSTDNTDCNDNDASVHPNALEQCNGMDDNCNGQIDESLNFITFYADADADTYGNPAVSVVSCVQPTGFVEDNTDCNDNDATVHSPQLYYVDADLDGFGSTTTAMLCSSTAPTGYSTDNTDCNDNDATVHTPQAYYIDVDLDGYGSAATAMVCSSTPPTGYSTNNTDCNDNDATVHTPQLYYVDADQDSYGSTTTAMLCSSTAPAGYSTNNTDCNDNNAAINPGTIEVCGNGLDDNCDGQVDENCAVYTYYADVDGDTYGNPASSITSNSNTPPAGYVTDNTDCNDNDATVHSPQLYYVDADHDGYGSTTTAMLCSSTPPTGYSTNNTDCNDNNAAVNPGATDICNGIDDNCNGTLDENPLVATVTPNGTVTYCRTVPVTLSANTGSGITYQWYKGVAPQSGETNSTFTTTKRGSFKVVETTGFCTSTSAYTSVARLATPQAAITVYGSTDICNTGSVLLRANNAGSNNTTHTYQWNKGGLTIFGATDRLYTATSTGNYTVTVTNSNGCSTTSSPVTVTSSCKETQAALIGAKLNLYPNPTHGTFNVELKLNDDVNVEADIQIINELGQSIFLNRTAVVNGELFDEITFDQTIPSGNYFVRILAGDKVYTGKIVYQK